MDAYMRLDLRPKSWTPETRVICATSLLLIATITMFGVVPRPTEVLTPILSILALTLAGAVMRRLRFAWITVGVILAGLVLYGIYFHYTGHNQRNFDTEHQIRYIRYLLAYRAAPPRDACFVCHHPPGYYMAAAAVYDVGCKIGLKNPLRAVQLLSLVCQFAFVLFGVLAVRRYARAPWILTLSAALLVFWPYSIIMSARIHNDAMAVPIMAAAMFFMTCWWQEERVGALVLSAGCVVLGVFVKSNALVLAAAWILLAVVKLVVSRDRPRCWQQVAPIMLMFTLSLGIHLGTKGRVSVPDPVGTTQVSNEASSDASGERSPKSVVARVLGSAYDISENAFVGNEPVNYLYFDVESFLREPYILARKKGGEREYFLNHFAKSSLFSTHNTTPDPETSYRINARIAGVMNGLLLLGSMLALGVAVRARREHLVRYFPMVLCVGALLGGMIGFRLVVPHAHHCDFRHAFPLLIPMILAAVLSIDRYRRTESVFVYVQSGLAGAFVLLSIVYFLPKYDLIARGTGRHVIEVSHTAVAKKVQAGAKWDAESHIKLEKNDRLQVSFPKREVDRLEIAVDHNDRYRVTIKGENGETSFVIPRTETPGMAVHSRRIDPSLRGVDQVVIEPVLGDWMYSVGHVVLHSKRSRGRTKALSLRPKLPGQQ